MRKNIHSQWLDVVLEGMALIGLVMVAFNSASFITLHFFSTTFVNVKFTHFHESLITCFHQVHRSSVGYRNTCFNFCEVAFNFDFFE
jgi:hypothetical protein